jgi:2,5-diketo-D-gluconate reductase A
LSNGVEMPVLGFGVFQIPAEETERAVIAALEAGYRSLDTARSYMNEEAVGRAIASSGVPRDELFITTKLWVEDQGEEKAKRAFDASLARLRLDYLDLFIIHQPFGDYYGSWRAMEELHRESWGPFAEGRNNLFTDSTLTEIGSAHDKSVAQVVLRWLIQRGVVVVQKSVRAERMRENMDIFDFQLSDAEMSGIAAIDRGESLFFDHHDPAMASQFANRRLN